MIRTLLFTTALAVAAPAMAQQTMTPDTAMPQAAPVQPDAATPQAGTPGATTPQAATPANPGNAVATIVDTEFPAYDADSDGELSQAEFSRWMVALKAQETKATGQTLPEAEVTAWANGAFVTADTDKNATISKPELVTYLSGGAA
ncbi:MAG: calcium-binding protein [Sphingomonadales bacterium RIFCSPLOWO2_12_FULL_63_15]|nr:MAG: calcium-binding protein [Sphingomonadales bacterium RIFCSPLOWO2_12_FULL_63_15]